MTDVQAQVDRDTYALLVDPHASCVVLALWSQPAGLSEDALATATALAPADLRASLARLSASGVLGIGEEQRYTLCPSGLTRFVAHISGFVAAPATPAL